MKILLTLLGSCWLALGFAQTETQLSGTLQNNQQEAIDLALVSLWTISDSTIVKSTYSDEDGSFQIQGITPGDYQLKVQMLGYDAFEQAVAVPEAGLQLPAITLTQAAQKLETVTVKAKQPFVERKLDRVIINPDALISNAGNNAIEMLEKAPGISLDNAGNLLLKGRSGVAVFLNDKPSYLSGTELDTYLRSLPAGSIKRVEIMVNPPARYDAAGNSGVINIILKRSTLKGFHGNLSASARVGRYTSSNNNLVLNYNLDKVSLYAHTSAGLWGMYQDLSINRFYQDENGQLTSAFGQNSYIKPNGRYLNIKTGIDLYPSERTTLGLSFRKNTSPNDRSTDNTALVTDPNGLVLQQVIADNEEDTRFDNEIYNAYWVRQLDSHGQSLSVDADYVRYQTGRDQVFKNFLYDAEGTLFFEDQINGDLPSSINIYAAKADYTKPLPSGARFEAGLKTAFTETDNEAIYTNTVDGVTSPDYGLSNRFLYDEWINAAYVNFTKSFGSIDLQAGLRGEHTRLEGEQLGNVEQPDTSFTRSYQSLFPTVYASWRVDTAQHHVLSFSYSQRINRPFFAQLNPFVSPLDKFTFYAGNPDLLPTFSNNFSLSYAWKNTINTTLNYSKTTDGINETLEIVDEIYYSRPDNIATNQTFSISVDVSWSVGDWYTMNAYAEYGYLTFDSPLYTETLASRGDYQYFSLNNGFNLGQGWKANVSGNYRSDLVYAQLLLSSYGSLDLGLQKSLLKNQANLKLAVSDLLFTSRGDGIINNLRRTEANWNSTRDTRRVTLTFSWRFGKNEMKRRRRNSSGSDSEQQRVGQ